MQRDGLCLVGSASFVAQTLRELGFAQHAQGKLRPQAEEEAVSGAAAVTSKGGGARGGRQAGGKGEEACSGRLFDCQG